MIIKKKRFKTLKLIISLFFMSLVLVVSVGGLTIIRGVNANENDETLATNTDIIKEHDLIVSDYNSSGKNPNKKETVNIETTEQAINLINDFFAKKAYVVTSKGKMGVSAKVDGIMGFTKVCDCDYRDYFEHQADNRAYWEEGYKVGKFYNSMLEFVYNSYTSSAGINLSNLNRLYYIDNETYFHQPLRGVNFTNGFNVDQNLLNSVEASPSSNVSCLQNYGYATSYFRWIINNDTVKNAKLIKNISGYRFDFDLDAETGARDVYKRFITWVPSNILDSSSAGAFSYSFIFNKFGNVVSFSRDETIKMNMTGKRVGFGITGSCELNFSFNYNVSTKNDDYKISVNGPLARAITSAGYSL